MVDWQAKSAKLWAAITVDHGPRTQLVKFRCRNALSKMQVQEGPEGIQTSIAVSCWAKSAEFRVMVSVCCVCSPAVWTVESGFHWSRGETVKSPQIPWSFEPGKRESRQSVDNCPKQRALTRRHGFGDSPLSPDMPGTSKSLEFDLRCICGEETGR